MCFDVRVFFLAVRSCFPTTHVLYSVYRNKRNKFGLNGVSSDYAFIRQALQLVLMGVPLLSLFLFSLGRTFNTRLYMHSLIWFEGALYTLDLTLKFLLLLQSILFHMAALINRLTLLFLLLLLFPTNCMDICRITQCSETAVYQH